MNYSLYSSDMFTFASTPFIAQVILNSHGQGRSSFVSGTLIFFGECAGDLLISSWNFRSYSAGEHGIMSLNAAVTIVMKSGLRGESLLILEGGGDIGYLKFQIKVDALYREIDVNTH